MFLKHAQQIASRKVSNCNGCTIIYGGILFDLIFIFPNVFFTKGDVVFYVRIEQCKCALLLFSLPDPHMGQTTATFSNRLSTHRPITVSGIIMPL